MGSEVDFRVLPEALADLDAAGIHYAVVIDDLQAPVDEERFRLSQGSAARSWFDDFKTLDQVRAYGQGLALLHPDSVSYLSLGPSLENRDIFALRITSPEGLLGKPALFVTATQHAREWIAVSSAMFLADALANGYGTNQAITELLGSFDVYIVPVSNPDGFEYTWTTDRYWRKNKRVVFGQVYGVDLNRNWGFKWGMAGSSSSASSDTYRGEAPFSEPESAAIRDFADSIPNLAATVDLHSYGRLILTPWGYTPTPPDTMESYRAVGNEMKGAIYGAIQQPYTVGPCNTTLYAVSGSSQDWFYGEYGVPSWLIELTQGPFVISPSAIVPTGNATVQAVIALASHLCPADIDGDGFVSGDDFDAFVGWFYVGDQRANFNRDLFVNGDDFDGFVDAFVRGCF